MDFDIPENLRMTVETVRRFVKQDLEPISRQVEEEDRIPEDVVQKMRELGLFGLGIPEEYGGLGMGCFGECLVYEEMGKVNACFWYHHRHQQWNWVSGHRPGWHTRAKTAIFAQACFRGMDRMLRSDRTRGWFGCGKSENYSGAKR